jgi:hypothetical protein
MGNARQDFLLQPYQYEGIDGVVWDFPLDDFYLGGVLQPTPYGDSDNQHILDIIVNPIGAVKQFPLLGFNLFQWLNSEATSDQIFNALSQNMKQDLYKVSVGVLKFTNNGFEINYDFINPAY